MMLIIGWSTHNLLVAGSPPAARGAWPAITCLFVPAATDVIPHLASYGFLLAIVAGLASGIQVLRRHYAYSRNLLQLHLTSTGTLSPIDSLLVHELGLTKRLDIIEVMAPIAFCHGYLRPRVVVSLGLLKRLASRELAALLLHEREHLRQLDPLKVAVGRLLAAALFFVPLVGALYRRFLVEKELAADRAAFTAQGSTAPLAGVLTVFLGVGGTAGADAGVGADVSVEVRVDALLGRPVRLEPLFGRAPLAGSLVVAILALVPLLIAAPAPSPHAIEARASVCHLADQLAPAIGGV